MYISQMQNAALTCESFYLYINLQESVEFQFISMMVIGVIMLFSSFFYGNHFRVIFKQLVQLKVHASPLDTYWPFQ